jgi:hypothetical protein
LVEQRKIEVLLKKPCNFSDFFFQKSGILIFFDILDSCFTNVPTQKSILEQKMFEQFLKKLKNYMKNYLIEGFLTKNQLAERRLTVSSHHQKIIWPIFLEKGHLTKNTFNRKFHLTEKSSTEGHLTETSFARKLFGRVGWLTEKVILPNAFLKKYHLSESSFDQKFI